MQGRENMHNNERKSRELAGLRLSTYLFYGYHTSSLQSGIPSLVSAPEVNVNFAVGVEKPG